MKAPPTYRPAPARGRRKLVRNAARCNDCGDVIESRHPHDFVRCQCGRLAVDGGLEYPRRVFSGTFTELSEYEGEKAA